jgi:hypothetical protein
VAIAGMRQFKATGAIFIVNLVFGWTVIGWFGSLVWALAGRSRREDELEARRHDEMMHLIAATKKAS